MKSNLENDAKVFKAFCDPNRLQILSILKSGEHCACKLLEILDVSQSTLSHHMKILTDAKIVLVRKDGKWSHYSLSIEGLDYAITYLQELTLITNDKCCQK
ncbi:MAG: metalloregulator ArsR/SmtB family transcription factor [Coprobacillus sp.]